MGTPEADVIVTYGGDDFIRARRGGDHVCAGAGADFVYGGDGVNYLEGGHGADLVRAGGIDSTVEGNGGNDRLYGRRYSELWGGRGHDVLKAQAFPVDMFGGPGNDRLVGGQGPDAMWGDKGDDVVLGREGDDTLFIGTGSDRIVGGPGHDEISALQAVTVNLTERRATGDNFTAALSGIEALSGAYSQGPVTFVGNGQANRITGSFFEDVLRGRGGGDWLHALLAMTSSMEVGARMRPEREAARVGGETVQMTSSAAQGTICFAQAAMMTEFMVLMGTTV